jgi:hypothetical protein
VTAVQPCTDQSAAPTPATEDQNRGAQATISIQLLHVPDCPNLDELRRRVESTLAKLGVSAAIDQVEGAYPSPTLIVNGVDVTGRPVGSDPSCRLDVPTDDQIITAIRRAAGPVKDIPVPGTAGEHELLVTAGG